MSRRKKAWLFGFAGAAGLLLVALFAAVGLVRTDWFKNKVRARIVSVAETATGGRVEIGTFDYNWQTLTVEVAPFVIHGKESPQAAPFFLADRIRIGLRVISFLDQQVDLVSLAVERPQISVIVNPDGSTNLPEPKSHGRWEKNFAEQLLDLDRQVDLVSLAVERPQISVIVNPDGSTNLPEPKSHGRWEKNFAEQLLDLKVQH